MSDHDSNNPLAAFSRLIGGAWEMDGNFHAFEWGVGKKIVNNQSFFLSDGERVLVSEGSWFWHAGEEVIKGYALAINMPKDLYDYTTEFVESKMVSKLRAYGSDGTGSDYIEEWLFTSDNTYEWSLFAQTPDGLQKVMGGLYTRTAA